MTRTAIKVKTVQNPYFNGFSNVYTECLENYEKRIHVYKTIWNTELVQKRSKAMVNG